MQLVHARAVLFASAAGAGLFAAPALAQENPATSPTAGQNQKTRTEAAQADDTTIVVTARRRNEVLLNVPIAVTAFTGEQLDRQGAVDITDLGETTPNVTFETSRGSNTTLTAFIRGVGQQDPVAGFEQGVGLYLDDVYLNRPQAALLDIYDVQRIEVLRGPQGTLYGRNTIGGAIKYVTAPLPDYPELKVRLNAGSYSQADAIVTASTPLGGGFKIGGTVARLSRGGFGKNLTTGQDNYNKDIWGTRGTLAFDPSPTVSFTLSGDYLWDNSNARGGHRLIPGLASGAPVLSDVFDSQGALNDPIQQVKGGGVALHGEIGLNDWLKFRTITAYRKDKSTTPIDFDALPAVDVDVPAIYKNRQFSQEFQLVADKGPLQGVAGFYYLNADAWDVFDVRLYTTLPTVLPGLTAGTFGDVKTKTWAAFADVTYDFSPQWSVSLGGRFTNDHRHADVLRQTYILGGQPLLGGSDGFGVGTVIATTSDFTGSRTDKAFTPRASISFKPNSNNNIYVSYSKGFKGGGFDPRGQSSQAPSQSYQDIYNFMTFKPEKVDSYELGWKAALFQHRLQFATDVFDAEYKDVQVPGSAGCNVGGVQTFCGITTNAGSARFRGFEFEGNALLGQNMAAAGDRLNLAGSLGYLDAKYLHFVTVETVDVNGQPFLDANGNPIAKQVDVADYRKIQNTPKWTASGSLDYNTPAWGGRLDLNGTLSYRSKSQQFEIATPMLDQKGFTLLDANLVWRSGNGRYEVGLHGKNLTNVRYISSGYNFLAQDPYTGQYLRDANGHYISTLGTEGILTAYYGAPRQVWVSFGLNF